MFCPALTRSTEIAESWFPFERVLRPKVYLSPAGLSPDTLGDTTWVLQSAACHHPRIDHARAAVQVRTGLWF
jgi:hypothetical protein